MRVFIKTSMLGIPETETEYVAWQGFQALGYKPVFFQDEKELEEVLKRLKNDDVLYQKIVNHCKEQKSGIIDNSNLIQIQEWIKE